MISFLDPQETMDSETDLRLILGVIQEMGEVRQLKSPEALAFGKSFSLPIIPIVRPDYYGAIPVRFQLNYLS